MLKLVLLVAFLFAMLMAMVVVVLVWRKSPPIAMFLLLLGMLVTTGIYVKRWSFYHLAKRVYTKVFRGRSSSSADCAVTLDTLKLSKDRYSLHRRAGKKRSDMKVVASNKERDALISSGVLVKLQNSKGYRVQRMNYGSPYVHSDMLSIINEIDARFAKKRAAKGLHHVSFVISSAYRTGHDQERLRTVNRNATKGVSSHSYGVSIDVPRLTGASCQKALPLFGRVLREMQKEKKIYLCPESNTLHITAR